MARGGGFEQVFEQPVGGLCGFAEVVIATRMNVQSGIVGRPQRDKAVADAVTGCDQ